MGLYRIVVLCCPILCLCLWHAVLIVTSTTGDGEIPDAMLTWYQMLCDEMPSLSHFTYGVIAFGDSSYPHFCRAGKMIDEMMQLKMAECQNM